MNVFIGAIGIVMVRAFVEESRDPTVRSLDLPGQVLFIVSVGALTYALIEGPHTGWTSPVIIGLLVGAVALGVGFVLFELHSPDPMMDMHVFADRVYSVAIVTLFVVLFSVYGLLLVITQYFQNVQTYSPERAGRAAARLHRADDHLRPDRRLGHRGAVVAADPPSPASACWSLAWS